MSIAIVVGASGLVGSNVVDQLVLQREVRQVVTLTRRPCIHANEKVVNHVINFDDLEQHKDLIKGDMLFSCLGTTLKRAGSIAAQRIVDIDYQLNAAKVAAENQVKHYLLVSSSGANYQSRNQYLRMKGELEQAIGLLNFEKISVFQPSLLLGERDHTRFGETLGGVILPQLCKLPGLRKYRPIKGEELAQKMVKFALSNYQSTGCSHFTLDQCFP